MIFAIAGASICVAAPARAQEGSEAVWAAKSEPSKPSNKEARNDDASLNLLRLDLGGSYFRGTLMRGHGTRVPYQGGAGTGRVDVRWFPSRPVGFEATAWYSLANQNTELGGGLQLALDVAPIRWSGPWGGGVILVAGGGFEVGNRSWMEKDVRAYPLTGLRLALWPTKTLTLRAAWDFLPVTTGALRASAHRIELSMGYRLLQFGARAGFMKTSGGDPVRTYGEMRFGGFVGVGFY
ncbi:MAG: hypothetical protein QM820_49745 [Minicystis sp.]